MKKSFTLVAALVLSITLYAFPNVSRISISANSHSMIRVMIDGNKYNTDNNVFVLNNLSPGYHTVKIYRHLRNVARNNPFGNSAYQLLYNANVYVKPQYHIDITINRFGKVFFDEQRIANGYTIGDDDWGGTDDNVNWNGHSDYTYNREMNTASFNRFIQTLKNESFESTRLSMAKQVIGANNFTTDQVREFMQLFSFENNKLEIATFAYRYTINKRDYFSLADCFSFSSNKEALMRYIQQYR